ncbi:MAG: hypothetical protein KY469_06605 [Actinobacteria bacterium]|nr:hypothetical protein [Actinomycetota bacterium]
MRTGRDAALSASVNEEHDQPLPGWALAGGAVTLLAVTLELLGSVLGDSPSTGYPGWLVPIAWPTAVRVAWWLVATAGAAATSHGLAHAAGRRGYVRTVVVAAPFLIFAVGIALGAEWATWH